jgi:hypothetical protein
MASPDSSMDESLEEFLAREGIKFERPLGKVDEAVEKEEVLKKSSSNAPKSVVDERGFDLDEFTSSLTNKVNTVADERGFDPSEFDMTDIQADLLLPACAKITDVLRANGFNVTKFDHNDIDMHQKLAVGAVDQWAESVIPCLVEMMERLDSRTSDLNDSVMSTTKRVVSHEALEANVRELQERLLLSERHGNELELKLRKHQHESKEQGSKAKDGFADSKKTIRGLEDKVKEHERRVRQRDSELQRLKEKLLAVAKKEKETAERHRIALDMLRTGEVSFNASNASFTSAKSAHSSSNSSSGGGGHGRNNRKNAPTAADVIAALENQRDSLEDRNAELDRQVVDLTGALRDSANNSRDGSFVSSVGSKDLHTEGDGSREEGGDSFDDADRSDSARAMYDKIKHQSREIAKLEHRINVFKASEADTMGLVKQLKDRNEELRERVENLRLELEVRPTPKQWAAKEAEVAEAENKLHDLVMMRGEAAELEAWRKHMSLTDRIKIDKRNHELGLWAMDSLPKTVTKEVLQAVCRELDVSDVSEVAPGIQKLKAVVKAVPRMERFISQVCAYLFERDPALQALQGRGLQGRSRPSMEDVLPVLQSWWDSMGKVEKLAAFQDKVLAELHRREMLLTHQSQSAGSTYSAILLFFLLFLFVISFVHSLSLIHLLLHACLP